MRKRFKSGEPVTALLADDYNEIAKQFEDRQRLSVVSPMELLGTDPAIVGISWPSGFYAKLSGSTSPYSFAEQSGATSGTWAAHVRTGTTNAYEVNGTGSLNNKVAWLEPGYPGEYVFQYLGSGSCTATINAEAKCGGVGSALGSVTFDLRDAADTTTLQSQTGSSASFTVTGTVGYKVRVTKTGYHTKISSTITPACGATVNATVSTWPTSYSFTSQVVLWDNGVSSSTDCPLSGATVAFTGDDSQSGTTDSSGNVILTFASTSTSVTQSLNYTITPPSGHGAAVLTGSISVDACSPSNRKFTPIPSSGHVDRLCNTRYLPDTLTWTDDYGTCDAVYDSGSKSWIGSYTYSSSHCHDTYTCPIVPFPVTALYAEQTGDVTASVGVTATLVDCSSTDFGFDRTVIYYETYECNPPTPALFCEPMSDAAYALYHVGVGLMGIGTTATSSCGTSISLASSISAIAATGCATYRESAVTISVGGTI